MMMDNFETCRAIFLEKDKVERNANEVMVKNDVVVGYKLNLTDYYDIHAEEIYNWDDGYEFYDLRVISNDPYTVGDLVWTGGDKLISEVYSKNAFQKVIVFRKQGSEAITNNCLNDKNIFKKVIGSTSLKDNLARFTGGFLRKFLLSLDDLSCYNKIKVEYIQDKPNIIDGVLKCDVVDKKENYTKDEVIKLLYKLANDIDDCYRIITTDNYLGEELLDQKWVEKQEIK